MTLLEGVIATVLLALVAVACLDGSRGAAQLQRRSQARLDALVTGETALAAAALETPSSFTTDPVRRTVTPYRLPALSRVDVDVRTADGTVVRLSRLVATPRPTVSGTP